MTFCSRESRFELYWQVIQQVYDFEANLPFYQIVPEFSEDLEKVLGIAYRNTQPYVPHSISASSSAPLFPELSAQISELLRSLGIDNEELLSRFPFDRTYEYTVYGRQCQSGANSVYWKGGNYMSRCLPRIWRNGLRRGMNCCYLGPQARNRYY